MAGNVFTLAIGTIGSGVLSNPRKVAPGSALLASSSSLAVNAKIKNVVTQTGNVLRFAPALTNTGTASSTIEVPSDAQLVVVHCSGWSNAQTNLFSGGSLTFTKGGADTALTIVTGGDANSGFLMGAIAYLALPDTGPNKTFKWDLVGTNAPATLLFTVTFWTGIDTVSPIRSSNAIQSGTVPYTSGTLTCQTGDLILANAFGSTTAHAAEGTIDSWSNLTLLDQTVRDGVDADMALAVGSPTGNTTVAASTGTNFDDGGIAAIVIKPATTVTIWQATTVLALSSNVFADSKEYSIAVAALPAAALLSVDTDQIWVTNPAILAATSSLAVNASVYKPAIATLPCTSSASVDAKIYIPAIASLSATSILAASASIAERGAAVLPLASDLLATAQIALVGRATLPLSSIVSAATIQYFVTNATLPLNSAYFGNANITFVGLATLPLNSVLNAATIGSQQATSLLALSGSVLADSFQRGQIAVSAVLTATSTLSCVGSQRWLSQSAYALSSNLSSFGTQIWLSVATLSAASNLLVNTVQRWSAIAQCNAASTLQAKADQKWLAISTLIANSTIIADGDSFGASNISPALKLSSNLRANATLVQAVFHWRRHITASGSLSSKQLKGAITRPSLTGEVS